MLHIRSKAGCPESMKSMSTHGLQFTLDVARVSHGDRVFAQMLELGRRMADVLGICTRQTDDLTPEVRAMVEERAQARKAKDWKRSDALRDAIHAAGYTLEDTPAGQKVRKNV